MRDMRLRSCLSLALLTAFVVACTTPVPATVVSVPKWPITDGHRIFVSAQRDRARVESALVQVGFEVDGTPDYTLEVLVGGNRRRRSCGTLNNVVYRLYSMDEGRRTRVAVIKGRGWTGNCEPNIWDEMSRALGEQFPRR